MPGDVRTVEQLLQWVRERKAQIQAQEPESAWHSRMTCLDALFEWTTGVEMPDPPNSDEAQSIWSRLRERAQLGEGGESGVERD